MDDASPLPPDDVGTPYTSLLSSSGCLLTGVIHAAPPILLESVQKKETHPVGQWAFLHVEATLVITLSNTRELFAAHAMGT